MFLNGIKEIFSRRGVNGMGVTMFLCLYADDIHAFIFERSSV